MSQTDVLDPKITPPQIAEAADAEMSLGKVIGAISAHLDPDRTGTGQVAGLRRMGWNEFPSAFWHFYFDNIPSEWRESDGRPFHKLDLAWATIFRAMAEVGSNSHSYGSGFGAALAETSYSEDRFVRLLRAVDEDLARELRTAATWLARAGRSANWQEPSELVLGRIGGVGRVRRPSIIAHRLARDYFRSAAAKSKS